MVDSRHSPRADTRFSTSPRPARTSQAQTATSPAATLETDLATLAHDVFREQMKASAKSLKNTPNDDALNQHAQGLQTIQLLLTNLKTIANRLATNKMLPSFWKDTLDKLKNLPKPEIPLDLKQTDPLYPALQELQKRHTALQICLEHLDINTKKPDHEKLLNLLSTCVDYFRQLYAIDSIEAATLVEKETKQLQAAEKKAAALRYTAQENLAKQLQDQENLAKAAKLEEQKRLREVATANTGESPPTSSSTLSTATSQTSLDTDRTASPPPSPKGSSNPNAASTGQPSLNAKASLPLKPHEALFFIKPFRDFCQDFLKKNPKKGKPDSVYNLKRYHIDYLLDRFDALIDAYKKLPPSSTSTSSKNLWLQLEPLLKPLLYIAEIHTAKSRATMQEKLRSLSTETYNDNSLTRSTPETFRQWLRPKKEGETQNTIPELIRLNQSPTNSLLEQLILRARNFCKNFIEEHPEKSQKKKTSAISTYDYKRAQMIDLKNQLNALYEQLSSAPENKEHITVKLQALLSTVVYVSKLNSKDGYSKVFNRVSSWNNLKDFLSYCAPLASQDTSIQQFLSEVNKIFTSATALKNTVQIKASIKSSKLPADDLIVETPKSHSPGR